MAVADANGLFTAIDVGDLGRNSDGTVFLNSSFGQLLKQGELNVPTPAALPGEAMVGDEAFPSLPYLVWPYPKRVLNDA
jgi:hypothetical protein